MPVIPATQEAEAGELPEPRGRRLREPRPRHCTPAWVTRAKLRLKKNKKQKTKKKLTGRDDAPVVTATQENEVGRSLNLGV